MDQCLIENQQASSRLKALSLVDMSSAFVVFGLGISLSILVFLIELIYKRVKGHYFTEHENKVKVIKAPLNKIDIHQNGDGGIPITKDNAEQAQIKVDDVDIFRNKKQDYSVPPLIDTKQDRDVSAAETKQQNQAATIAFSSIQKRNNGITSSSLMDEITKM